MNLEEIYRQTIVEHSRSKKNKHDLENPTFTEKGHNPSCGDDITLQVELSEDKKIVKDLAFTGIGCAISQASASMMCDLLRGKSVEEAKELAQTFIGMIRREITDEEELEKLDDALALQNISNMPARVKCALLAWHTFDDLVENDIKNK